MEFNGSVLNVTPTNDPRQWFMLIEDVAAGYGVDRTTIMKHLEHHAGELREGLEKGVNICHTLGGPQQKTVIYREGVIKLGFFVRSRQAAAFRQWATAVVIQHLDEKGIDLRDLVMQLGQRFDQFSEQMIAITARQQTEIDDLKAQLSLVLTQDDEKTIYDLIQEVKREKNMDGRAVVGHVKKLLGLHTPYEKTSVRMVINALNNMLGRGITTVK